MRPQIARMKYRVKKLPPYIILHMRRFTKNNFFVEKNPTLGKYHVIGLADCSRQKFCLYHQNSGLANFFRIYFFCPFTQTPSMYVLADYLIDLKLLCGTMC